MFSHNEHAEFEAPFISVSLQKWNETREKKKIRGQSMSTIVWFQKGKTMNKKNNGAKKIYILSALAQRTIPNTRVVSCCLENLAFNLICTRFFHDFFFFFFILMALLVWLHLESPWHFFVFHNHTHTHTMLTALWFILVEHSQTHMIK